MTEFTILPPLEIDRITELLKAASWCKTPDMELVLAITIRKFINPPIIYNESKVQDGNK